MELLYFVFLFSEFPVHHRNPHTTGTAGEMENNKMLLIIHAFVVAPGWDAPVCPSLGGNLLSALCALLRFVA